MSVKVKFRTHVRVGDNVVCFVNVGIEDFALKFKIGPDMYGEPTLYVDNSNGCYDSLLAACNDDLVFRVIDLCKKKVLPVA